MMEINNRKAEVDEFPVIFLVHGKSAGAQELDGLVAARHVQRDLLSSNPSIAL